MYLTENNLKGKYVFVHPLGVRSLLNPASNYVNEWKWLISSPSKEQHHEKVNKVLDLVSSDTKFLPL